MAVKPGGLLDSVIKITEAAASARTCETCGNLVQLSETALGCAAHDKLIIPEYPPYHGYMKCPDWAEKKGAKKQ